MQGSKDKNLFTNESAARARLAQFGKTFTMSDDAFGLLTKENLTVDDGQNKIEPKIFSHPMYVSIGDDGRAAIIVLALDYNMKGGVGYIADKFLKKLNETNQYLSPHPEVFTSVCNVIYKSKNAAVLKDYLKIVNNKAAMLDFLAEQDFKGFSDIQLMNFASAIAQEKGLDGLKEKRGELLSKLVSKMTQNATVLKTTIQYGNRRGKLYVYTDFYKHVLPLIPMPDNARDHPLVKMTFHSSKGAWMVIDDIVTHTGINDETKPLLKAMIEARVAQKHFAYRGGKGPEIDGMIQRKERGKTLPDILTKLEDAELNEKVFWAYPRIPYYVANAIFSHKDSAIRIYNNAKNNPSKLKTILAVQYSQFTKSIYNHLDNKDKKEFLKNPLVEPLEALDNNYPRLVNVVDDKVKDILTKLAADVNFTGLDKEVKTSIVERFLAKSKNLMEFLEYVHESELPQNIKNSVLVNQIGQDGKKIDESVIKLITVWDAVNQDIVAGLANSLNTLSSAERIELLTNLFTNPKMTFALSQQIFAQVEDKQELVEVFNVNKDREDIAVLIDKAFEDITISEEQALQYVREMDVTLVSNLAYSKNQSMRDAAGQVDREKNATTEKLTAWLNGKSDSEKLLDLFKLYKAANAESRSVIKEYYKTLQPQVVDPIASNTEPKVLSDFYAWAKNALVSGIKDKEEDPKDLLKFDFDFLFNLKEIHDAREEGIKNPTGVLGRFNNWVSGLFAAAKKAEDPRIQELAEKFDAAVNLQKNIVGENHGDKEKQRKLGGNSRIVLEGFLKGNELHGDALTKYGKLEVKQKALVMEISLRYALRNGQGLKVQQILENAFNNTDEQDIKKAAFRAIHRYKNADALGHYLKNIDNPSDALDYLKKASLKGFTDKQLMDYAVAAAKYFKDQGADGEKLSELMTKFMGAMTQSSSVLKDRQDFYDHVLPRIKMPEKPKEHPLVKMTWNNSKGAWKVMDDVVTHTGIDNNNKPLLKAMVEARVAQAHFSTGPGGKLIDILKAAKNPELNAQVFGAMLEKREAFIKAGNTERSGYDNVILYILTDLESAREVQKMYGHVHNFNNYTKVKDQDGTEHDMIELAKKTLGANLAPQPKGWMEKMTSWVSRTSNEAGAEKITKNTR